MNALALDVVSELRMFDGYVDGFAGDEQKAQTEEYLSGYYIGAQLRSESPDAWVWLEEIGGC